MKPIALAVPFLALAACAQRPDAIAPVMLPFSAYSAMECGEAKAELAAARSNLSALERQQNSAATGDAWGVFLLGVPMSSLTGGDKAGEVAVAKGRVLSLESRTEGCA